MLGNKKPSDLDDWTLLAVHDKCGQFIAIRNEASKHPKFNGGPKRMAFPPPNPAFIEMMNSIEDELKKRKLL